MRAALAASLAGLVAGCAGYAPTQDVRAGSTEAQVLQAMGQPTGRYPLPASGQRLEFARGRHTYMVDLDAGGRVVEYDQVLQPRYFDAVNPGLNADDLLRFIGRPSERHGARGKGEIWSWRYANNDCLWWQAQLDGQGIVTQAGYGPLPGCMPK